MVLSVQETTRLIAAATNVKHQAALSVAYGAGLRASEVVHLKVTDVDGERMTLRVEQGKGRKDRYAMLSPVLLQRLRTWWRVANAQGRMRPGGWLFPGMDPTDPLTPRLSSIKTPVVVIGAEHDQFCPQKAASLLLEAMPGAEFLNVPEAGHLMGVDNPGAVTVALRKAMDK